jgi:hypothetical protein
MADDLHREAVILIFRGSWRGVHTLITSHLAAASQASQEVDNAPINAPQGSPYQDTGKGKGIYLYVEGTQRPVCEECGYIDGRSGTAVVDGKTRVYLERDIWRTSLPGYISQWRLFCYRLIGL